MSDEFLPDLDRFLASAGAHQQPSLIDGWLAALDRRKAEPGRTSQELTTFDRRREQLLQLRQGPPRPLGTSTI
jgi:hypothetical protein